MAQRDLHFYATLALAKAAGYSDEDAKLLAWADEECDYTLQVKAWNCLWSNLGLQFHFLPGDPKDLICRVDSELSRRIMASVAVSKPETWRYYMAQDLCALGIALHGLQDTYSHDGWVGKFSRHNVLPAWSHDKFTPSLPFPYGHSPKGREPDIANATWYDPRTNQTINNIDRVESALFATSQVLGLDHTPAGVSKIFANVEDYEARKQALRELAGMPNLRFSEIRAEMLKRYGAQFKQAAAAQATIIKKYLKG